jgi:hypothetical protein
MHRMGMQPKAVVYHGSPHQFDEFDASKIGTGEGAQAYGRGSYLAESPGVAESYKKTKGNLYKVDLPDEKIARMLDWDKPLSEQAHIQEVAKRLGLPAELPRDTTWGGDASRPAQGMEFYSAGRTKLGEEGFSDAMRQAGIPGIRYLDQASREAGKGTSNYVVFPGEEKGLKILERNGELIKALAPPPLAKTKIPYGEGVDPQYRVAETAFQKWLKSEPDLSAKYAALPDSQGGRVISADAAKKLMPEFLQEPGPHSVVAHEGASATAKNMYVERLKQKPGPGDSKWVLMTGGGAGSGKTTAVRAFEKAEGAPHTIYDSNMGTYASSEKKFEQALKAGLNPVGMYTYRDPVEATVKGVIKRALNPDSPDFGRVVPAHVIAQTHVGSRDVIEQLAAKYADNPRVKIMAYANMGKVGEATPVPIASLPKLDYNDTYGKIRQAIEAERAAGRLPDNVYNALVSEGRGGGGAVGEAVPGRSQQPGQPQASRPLDDATRQRYADALGYDMVELRSRYPKTGEPVLKTDEKTGKQFYAKELTPEEEAVQTMRKAAQAEINKGNYQPAFPKEDRYYANPEEFPVQGRTITDEVPKMEKTAARLRETYQTPEAYARLLDAYKRAENNPDAHDFYAMGQLADAYKAEYGAEEGAKRYVDMFTKPMAATTGGADPTGNLLSAMYGNYLKERGLKIPENSWEFPHPVGGRFIGGNMKMYDKHLMQGAPFTSTNEPKRFNFDANFRGYQDRATMDEVMSGGVKPGLKAPPAGHYGTMEEMVHKLADQVGTTPSNFQSVDWVGIGNKPGQPMIEDFNHAVERTAWVLGLSREEAKRHILRGGTTFGLGGVAAGGALMPQGDETVR